MKQLKKIGSIIVLGFIILYAGYITGYWAKYYIYQYKANPERILKKDIFGGKTPQETYEMFVSAFKANNFELASKYFVLSKQEEKLKEFQDLKEKGELDKYIEGLPGWGEVREEKRIEENIKEFRYSFISSERKINFKDKTFILPAGEYTASIIFRLNSFTNIWKIEIL